VAPTDSLEVWRRDLGLLAYRIQMADNPAHSLVTSDYAILAYKTILWWLYYKAMPTILLLALNSKPSCFAKPT